MKASRRMWALAGLVVAVFATIAVLLVPGFRQARLIGEIETSGVTIRVKSPFPEWLDEALAKVCGDRLNRIFGRVAEVRVDGIWFNDDHLVRVARFESLDELELYNTSVTDAGLLHVSRLSSLEALDLRWCNVTANGLKQLEVLPRLQNLWLSGSRFTDDVEPVLLRMPALKHVVIEETSVSQEVVERLRRKIPEVEWRGRPKRLDLK